MPGEFTKIDEMKDYFDLVNSEEPHVVLRYGCPCEEYAQDGGVVVFYGAPCNFLDKVDFGCDDQVVLKYGAPCKPPYIIVKYGGPCKKIC